MSQRWQSILKVLISLALVLGFPGVPTLLVQATAGGPAPVEEREERVAERVAEDVHKRGACQRGAEAAGGKALESGLARRLLTVGSPRAPQPARDTTRLALGLSTTRLRC